MTLVADIIDEAFRECGLISELEHPTPVQAQKALGSLQSIIDGAYYFETGEPLVDWDDYYENISYPTFVLGMVPNNQYPQSNIRILVREQNMPSTIYLQKHPLNGARVQVVDPLARLAAHPLVLDANGALIEGTTSVTLNTNSLNRTWRYNYQTAAWVVVEGIEFDDEMPFPREFDIYFQTRLAMELDPRYATEVPPSVLGRLAQAESRIKARFRQSTEMPSERGLWPRNYWGYSWTFGR